MERYLYLPKQYDLVVGEPFELFFRGIVNGITIETYDFELFYDDGKNRGKGFSRKYYFVPEERRSAVDWYTSSIILHDINSKVRK